MLRPAIAALVLSAAVSGCGAPDGFQPAQHLGHGDRDGAVVAESRYGAASIAAPVRSLGNGRYEVRLPGGTWVDCHLSCSETLRRETVDFWQNHSGHTNGDDGPGYFTWTR